MPPNQAMAAWETQGTCEYENEYGASNINTVWLLNQILYFCTMPYDSIAFSCTIKTQDHQIYFYQTLF